MRRLLTLSCASFSPIALERAIATSISLFVALKPGNASSKYLETLTHTFCNHSFDAESAKSPSLVNICIFQRRDRAFSTSIAVGFLLFINDCITFTNSSFHGVGVTLFFHTLAYFFNTSFIAFCNDFT